MLKIFVIAAALFSAFALATDACAQTISGIRVGDHISTTSKLGISPVSKNQSGPFDIVKWNLPDRNILSVTSNRNTGRIVFIECDWVENLSGRISDYPIFYYGKTTLSDIRRSLGSNGIGFRGQNGGAVKMPNGSIAMFNTYEIESQPNLAVTFVTNVSKSSVNYLKSLPTSVGIVGDYAILDSIILADTRYLEGIWGDRIPPDPAYSKISWVINSSLEALPPIAPASVPVRDDDGTVRSYDDTNPPRN